MYTHCPCTHSQTLYSARTHTHTHTLTHTHKHTHTRACTPIHTCAHTRKPHTHTGVEHLLRDVKDATISTLATDVGAKLEVCIRHICMCA